MASPDKREYERRLERLYPEIAWAEPVTVTLMPPANVTRYGCRYCIAIKGLKGSQVAAELWETPAEVLDHIEAEHQ